VTSSSEQTTALIAELRRAADKKRADLALQSAALFTRAADALEAATPRVVSTVAEREALDRLGHLALRGASTTDGRNQAQADHATVGKLIAWVGGTE